MAASNGAVEVDVVDDAGGLLGPRPAWLARQRFACWSGGPDLVGWALWGHCADDDAEAGKRMWIELARRIGDAARPGGRLERMESMDGRKKSAGDLHSYSDME